MVAPARHLLQLGHSDVEYRKDKIAPLQHPLVIKKEFKLRSAVAAVDDGRRNDRDEEYGLFDGDLDLVLPQLAGNNRLLVLPQAQLPARTSELAAQFALNSVAQRAQSAGGVIVIFARIAEEPHQFREVGQTEVRRRLAHGTWGCSRRKCSLKLYDNSLRMYLLHAYRDLSTSRQAYDEANIDELAGLPRVPSGTLPSDPLSQHS